MNTQTLTIAGTTLTIIPANDDDEHIETIMYETEFSGQQHFKIFDYGSIPNRDRYSYEDPEGSRYSHPTLQGARNMIASSLVKLGIIEVPHENQHLSEANMARCIEIQKARTAMGSTKPIVGDIVMINGLANRISNCLSHGAQTSKSGSIHIGRNGYSSFSGGLDASRLYECFQIDGTTLGRFWMWDAIKGMGGGNGVYINLEVNRWVIIDVKFSREEAANHASILHYRKIFGSYKYVERDVERKIEKLMKGFDS